MQLPHAQEGSRTENGLLLPGLKKQQVGYNTLIACTFKDAADRAGLGNRRICVELAGHAIFLPVPHSHDYRVGYGTAPVMPPVSDRLSRWA